VQLYADIGAEFASGALTTQNVTWNTTTTSNGLFMHQLALLNEWEYGEIQDYSRDATIVFATDNVKHVSCNHSGNTDEFL